MSSNLGLPVARYVEPVFSLETSAYEGASVTRYQIELLANLNAHVQRLVGVVVFALWICHTTHFVYDGGNMASHQPTDLVQTTYLHGRTQAWARGSTCPPSGNVVKCFVHYSKTFSRRDIYALCSQPVIGFWDPHQGFIPRPHTPNLPTREKNPAGTHKYLV